MGIYRECLSGLHYEYARKLFPLDHKLHGLLQMTPYLPAWKHVPALRYVSRETIRDKAKMSKGLLACGEGAGYAGGIRRAPLPTVSA